MGIKITSMDGTEIYELVDIDQNICQHQLNKLVEDNLEEGAFKLMQQVAFEGKIANEHDILTIMEVKRKTLGEYVAELDQFFLANLLGDL